MKLNKDKFFINLASEEYFQSVKEEKFGKNLIHIRFEEKRAGVYKVISFNAKKARGYMARHIIKKINSLKPKNSKDLILKKYSFDASRSNEQLFTFVR